MQQSRKPPFLTLRFVTRASALACLVLACSSESDPASTGGNTSSAIASSSDGVASTTTGSVTTSASSSGTTSAGSDDGGATTASTSTDSTTATSGAGGATSTNTNSTSDGGGSGGVLAVGGAGGTSSTETTSSAGGATTVDSTTSSGGSGGSGGTTASFQPCPTDGSPCKIMPFGDSITDGFGVAGAYRVELFRLAIAADKNITFVGSGSNGPSEVDGVPFPPNHEGHSGYTIEPETGRSGISPLVSTVMPQYTPHIVLLMIGTNDAIDDIEMQDAPTRLGTLIDSIYDELPEILIVVARPIPSQDDALNTRLLTYGEEIPAVVQARADAGRHIAVVDMYPVIADEANYKTELLQDTWHPNAAGHALLGAEWFRVLEEWW